MLDFTILSHAGLRVRGGGISLLVDPWIVGSCYWRSWWNYPPVAESLVRELKPDAIYLTHLHWDHFHGVSLRRFPRQTRILVPRGHHDRIRRDLQRIGFGHVQEIEHAASVSLAPGFRITSYQISPFLDSAVVVECEGVTLLDANDAKFMGGPLRQILKRHPRVDFVFRSHSSANSRLSYEVVDDPETPVDDPAHYVDSFAAFALASRARYAVPFASNHCYLHKDVYALNGTIQTPRMVEDHFRTRGITAPRAVIMLSGDSWSSEAGFRPGPSSIDYFDRRTEHLERYRAEKAEVLDRFYAAESRARVRLDEVRTYFSAFLAAVPWFLRLLYKGRPVRYVLKAGDVTQTFEVDLYRRTVREVAGPAPLSTDPFEVHTSAFVFRQCMALDLFSHLAISKRARYRVTAKSRRSMVLLNLLFNLYEYDYLPLRSALTGRLVRNWLRRWREMLLYVRMAAGWIVKGRPSEAEYIARGSLGRRGQIGFSNHSPASDR
jgi:UDP-MurNAc hydroxylase